MESSSEDVIPKYGYYKIQIKTVKEGKEIYPNFKEIVSSLNKVQGYFGEDYRNIITQILEETHFLIFFLKDYFIVVIIMFMNC